MLKKIFTGIVYMFAFIGFGLTVGFFAIKFGLTNTKGIIDTQRENFLANTQSSQNDISTPYWTTLPEWNTLRYAIVKDTDVITRASRDSGVPARLIVLQLFAEQMRFFFDDRESYKKFFEPLKILGSQTQFSWGVMGIKEETAVAVENHLKDTTSPYYLGADYEHILDFKTTNVSGERFTRMTDQHNHYYSYLYAGLYLHQVESQWKKAGFSITDEPDIISTLYNIGFKYSIPNADPQSGGAEIPVGGQIYSFGQLASEFYNSNELLLEFPR